MRLVALSARVALGLSAVLLTAGSPASTARAQYAATVEIAVKDKKFAPAEVKAPAGKRIVIHVTNRDGIAMEFESKSLKVEKVVPANGEGILRVGPLKPGRYDFFDDFNQANTGTLVVE
jgi:hypothetical protein